MKFGNYKAPAAIVVCANLELAANESAQRFWAQDCSAATENIHLAAAGMDLGTVWIGSYPKNDVMNVLRETLGIPKGVIPLSLVYVGILQNPFLPVRSTARSASIGKNIKQLYLDGYFAILS